MDPRRDMIWQARDMIRCIAGAIACLGLFLIGVWRLIVGDQKIAGATFALSVVAGIQAWFYFGRVRRSIRAEEEFVRDHRGKIDWKGAPLSGDDKNKPA